VEEVPGVQLGPGTSISWYHPSSRRLISMCLTPHKKMMSLNYTTTRKESRG
jgi:hypothetical protein